MSEWGYRRDTCRGKYHITMLKNIGIIQTEDRRSRDTGAIEDATRQYSDNVGNHDTDAEGWRSVQHAAPLWYAAKAIASPQPCPANHTRHVIRQGTVLPATRTNRRHAVKTFASSVNTQTRTMSPSSNPVVMTQQRYFIHSFGTAHDASTAIAA